MSPNPSPEVLVAFDVLNQVAKQLGRALDRPTSELVQLGACGLLRALGSFDPSLSPLRPYLARRSRWAILDGLRSSEHTRSRNHRRARVAFEVRGRLSPELEIADVEDGMARRLLALAARAAVSELPPRERVVIEWMYFEDAPLAVAAHALGVSRTRACRLHRRALSRLRARLDSNPPGFESKRRIDAAGVDPDGVRAPSSSPRVGRAPAPCARPD